MDKAFRQIENVIARWFTLFPFMDARGKVLLSQPLFGKEEIIALLRVMLLSNGWIAQGPKVAAFEKAFALYIGVSHAVATNSGSSANLLVFAALLAMGRLKKGDEVIIPASVFPTVATPVVQLGLIPVFVDVDLQGNIDPLQVRRAISKKTKVVMVVHTLGKPADVISIQKILRGKNILLFEDACEAHGASIGKKRAGSFGDVATFSFYVAHNMTTGEGGMVVTNNKKLATLVSSLRDFGRVTKGNFRFGKKDKVLGIYDTRYLFTNIGYNVRLTDMQAAMGIEQLKKLESMNKKRIHIAKHYLLGLSSLQNYFILPKVEKNTVHVFYGFLLVVKKDAPFCREEIVMFLESNGIETRPLFSGCLPDQPAFRNVAKRIVGGLPNARFLRDNAFFIGCHPGLTAKDVARVITSIHQFL